MTTSTTNNKLIDKLKGSGARRLQGRTVAASPTSAPLSVVHAHVAVCIDVIWMHDLSLRSMF